MKKEIKLLLFTIIHIVLNAPLVFAVYNNYIPGCFINPDPESLICALAFYSVFPLTLFGTGISLLLLIGYVVKKKIKMYTIHD